MNDNTEQDQGGFMQRLQESPRTVSALIIILIVAAAIYAFSGEEGTEQSANLAGGEEATEEMPTTDGADTEATDETETVAGDAVSEEAAEPQEQMAPEIVREAERTDEGFVEVAAAGEGITHLARRASTRWLSENQVDFAVTDAHRIYIEDYIQNRVGSDRLALQESRTITFALIQEAVEAARGLNETQLQNLSQYTTALQ